MTFTPHRVRVEVLAGLTVALALIPEAVAFAFVAGVEPLVGLYAAFIVGLITAVFGGRPVRARRRVFIRDCCPDGNHPDPCRDIQAR